MDTNERELKRIDWILIRANRLPGAVGSLQSLICVKLRDLTPEDFGAAVEAFSFAFIRVHSRSKGFHAH
jgi:hypothetical protein